MNLICWDCARVFRSDDAFALQCPICVERDAREFTVSAFENRAWTNRRIDMQERLSVSRNVDE